MLGAALVGFPILVPAPAAAVTATSLRFGGGGVATPGADRVLIPVNPTNAADVGAASFTIELWMAATAADNPSGDVGCDGANYSWITGHILLDRDRFPGVGSDGRDFGVSLTTTGRVAFGVENASNAAWTTCTSGVNVLDGAWHHVAVQRSTAGLMQIWVDGVKRAERTNGPSGDISYPDGAPTNRPGSDPYLVVGAEKHDAGAEFPSYRGRVDELRLSTGLRYGATFTRPSAPFSPDASTAVLYHFDGNPGVCPATLVDAMARVNATCVPSGGLPALDAVTPFGGGPPPPPATPTTFHPITPARLTDTRPDRVVANGYVAVQVTGANGVPANAQAAALNLTAVGPASGGYLTAWPCGQPPPPTSNLNYAPGQTIANFASIRIGNGGQICVSTSAIAAIVVDLTGWWGDGGIRYGTVTPYRLRDTRPAAQGENVVLQAPVRTVPGVPVTAQAASLNLTVVGPAGGGFLTAWPCGQPKPNTSNLNYGPGQTIANFAAMSLGTGGQVCITTSAAAAIVVDVTGWWGPTGSMLLQPDVVPGRPVDTRPMLVPAGGVVPVPVPAGVDVAIVNLTVTGPTGGGYLTAWNCAQPRPGTSNLNYGPGQTVAAAALVSPGSNNQLCVYTYAATYLVVDLFGGMA